ncbi:MAG: hypothetical protein ACTSU6_02215, partial [Candidatus Njordarchaeales archaeon]
TELWGDSFMRKDVIDEKKKFLLEKIDRNIDLLKKLAITLINSKLYRISELAATEIPKKSGIYIFYNFRGIFCVIICIYKMLYLSNKY